jgi:hypothetical protein
VVAKRPRSKHSPQKAMAKKNLTQRAERFPIQRPIYYRQDDSSVWLEGITENISHTGILFIVEQAFKPSKLLEIRVAFALSITLSCLGAVVRTEYFDGKTALAVQIRNYNLLSHDKTTF